MAESVPKSPLAIEATAAPPQTKASSYPEPFASRMGLARSGPWATSSV